MFEKFGSQKTDDAFVEAATDASARQKYIDRLVRARSWLTVSLVLCLFILVLRFVSDLFGPARSTYLQSSGDMAQSLVFSSVFASFISTDLAIKFLKALEAGAKQAAPTEV